MNASAKKFMKASEIPSFVEEIINAGCDICAIGSDGYVVGDADLSEEEYEIAAPELERIKEKYGDRDFLLAEIAVYLRSIGRYIDVGSPVTHWSENVQTRQ